MKPVKSDEKLVYSLIEKVTKHWTISLFYACKYGHENIVRIMIEKGIDDSNNFPSHFLYLPWLLYNLTLKVSFILGITFSEGNFLVTKIPSLPIYS